MSQHDRPSVRAQLLGRFKRAEEHSASLEQVERGCVRPGGDPRAQAHGQFRPLV